MTTTVSQKQNKKENTLKNVIFINSELVSIIKISVIYELILMKSTGIKYAKIVLSLNLSLMGHWTSIQNVTSIFLYLIL